MIINEFKNVKEIFYNDYLDKQVCIYEYEEICIRCKGSGWKFKRVGPCNVCSGNGKLSWIDKIMKGNK